MPHLTVVTGESSRQISFAAGPSLRDILDATDMRVRCGCRGNGLCGLCLIQIVAGEVNPPTINERLMLGREQLARNIRLACQVMPRHDLSIKIINAAPASNWQILPPIAAPLTPAQAHLAPVPSYGVAVDLGTTHISASLLDLRQGARITGRTGLNPQWRFGADVMTRLVAAGESPDDARKMSRMAFDSIREAMLDICLRHGVNPLEIVRLSIVGNTPMLAILTESTPEALLRPESWTREMQCPLRDPQTWVNALGLHPTAVVEVVPPLAGFVGSDLLAGVLATRLTAHPGGLLIDFGTNSEMALWDGTKLWATSAAGGPAFEGSGIPCGMPAESGAIDRATLKPNSEDLEYNVIGDGKAKGICGSGLVDLIACLLRAGRLTLKGKFVGRDEGGFAVGRSGSDIRLDAKGVDFFQHTKAAIGVGIKTLLTMADMNIAQLQRVCVCGAFGQYLDVANAQAIGLLPIVSPERVELCGNTALGGCEILLRAPEASAELSSLRKHAIIINLAQVPDFDTAFMECLYLRPLEVKQS